MALRGSEGQSCDHLRSRNTDAACRDYASASTSKAVLRSTRPTPQRVFLSASYPKLDAAITVLPVRQ